VSYNKNRREDMGAKKRGIRVTINHPEGETLMGKRKIVGKKSRKVGPIDNIEKGIREIE